MGFILDSVKLQSIICKKKILDNLIKFNQDGFDHLILNWFRTETTYSSNAIEGNTLSKLQTESVINDGITVGGKTIVEHLEAINHAKTYDLINIISNHSTQITEDDILSIHGCILKNIDDSNAGRYRNIPVRISGSSTILPNYQKVPMLMDKMLKDLATHTSPIHQALFMHYQLVTIHPFVDGNGRTARLLMNCVLLKNGYPPAVIRKSSKISYLRSLETAQTKDLYDEYVNLMLASIEKSLDICIKHCKTSPDFLNATETNKVYKIGALSRITCIPNSTIRHWINNGILTPHDITDSGYMLFNESDITICKKVLELQKNKMTLKEISSLLKVN